VHTEINFVGRNHAEWEALTFPVFFQLMHFAEKQVRGSMKVNKLEIFVSYCS